MAEPVDDFLAHYGVKGMKWGERKAAQKNFEAWGASKHASGFDKTAPLSESEYQSFSAKPIKLGDKQTVYKRIAAPDNTKLGGMIYVTNNDKDHNTYTAFFPGSGDTKFLFNKAALTIHADKDLISPGKKERVDLFIETLGQKIPDDSGSIHTGRTYALGSDEPAYLKAMSDRQIGLEYYNVFAQSQYHRTPLHEAYFEKVKSKGYNALFDDADGGYISNTPIIMFPEKASARVTEVKMLSEEDVLRARLNLDPTTL